MTCRSCRFHIHGTCRRYAPAPLVVSRVLATDRDVVPLWCRVSPEDTCGEWAATSAVTPPQPQADPRYGRQKKGK